MFSLFRGSIFCALTLIVSVGLAQQKEGVVKTYVAGKLDSSHSLNIDGLLTDSAWEGVEWGNDFVEQSPDENTAPAYQTQFKVRYDAKFLYFGIRCFDAEPEKIVKRLTRRDVFDGDRISINIDSYHDKRTGFSFTISAAGVKGDEFISRNGQSWDESWNPIWYAATNIDDKGWTAEVKIPFSQLKFGNSKEQQWGLQLSRAFFRTNERSVWQRFPRTASGWVSNFGILRGLFDIQPQKQLEIQPFTVTKFDTYPSQVGNPFRDGNDFNFNGGLDAKIGITNDLTLDLTVNPDFGQVEADPGAIALDGFQIFFEEQRPFFVENKNIFDFRFANGRDNLFYSRRIGRNPQGNVDSSAGEFVDKPQNTTILGAAKFSGKTKNGWSLGLLESVTGNMFATIDSNGDRREQKVEPLTNYLVARAQKDFNDRNSFVGGMFTATNRNLNGGFNYLRKAAYTGGMDFRHLWDDQNYVISGKVVASHVVGSKESIEKTQRSQTHLFQRVDAGHVSVDPNRTSMTGTGGNLVHSKIGGGHWRYITGFNWRSPELELNDIGFLRSADEIRQFSRVTYETLKPDRWMRQGQFRFWQLTTYDFDGNHNRTEYQLQANVNWLNNWWTELELGHKPRIFINSFLRGGPRWRFSEENFIALFFGSDQTKKFNFTLGHVKTQARQDNFSFRRYVMRFNYQPINSLQINLETSFEENPNRTQYVSQKSYGDFTRYILGGIQQQTWNTALRINYSINPNLSVQFYGSPFISRGRYSEFNYVNNAPAEDLYQRVTWYDSQQISQNGSTFLIDENRDGTTDYQFENPDFSFVQFRSNLVIRWEYIPGSELFLVWSRGVDGSGDVNDSLSRSIKTQVFDAPADDTFLLKATYRFVL